MNAKEIAQKAKLASYRVSRLLGCEKNSILTLIANAIYKKTEEIIKENKKDLEYGEKIGLASSLMDRLLLNEKRINEMVEGIKNVVSLPDPVGEIYGMKRTASGLIVGKMRVPLGVIGIVYEARPNVGIDAFSLCFKSGNSCILKGGVEAKNSNKYLVSTIKDILSDYGLSDIVFYIEEREAIKGLAQEDKYIDCIILRGGRALIDAIGEGAKVPIVAHGEGICHVYIDNECSLDMAGEIAFNAKVQRPGVCNAMETLLVHWDIAHKILPPLVARLKFSGCEIRGCEKTQEICPDVISATEADWKTEYLALILSIKIVSSLDEAIGHINYYGSHHSDAIVTNSYKNAMEFLQRVDSSAVYVNASTRFTDGGEFGLGAEIGISTQKLHARGPMGLKELTSSKFIIFGNGQIRK